MSGNLNITTFANRRTAKGKLVKLSWSELVTHLSSVKYTNETMAEYKALPDDERGDIKDVGGFVGGPFAENKRSKANILSRSVVTLDADEAKPTDWDEFSALYSEYNVCVYPTHSYTPEAPRLRWVFPLSRDVTPEEYVIIAHVVADWVGVHSMDESTYQPERLMYWPSAPKDCPYKDAFHSVTDGDPIDADEVLGSLRAEEVRLSAGADGAAQRTKLPSVLGSDSSKELPDVIPCGTRDNALAAIAGRLRRIGMGPSEIRAALDAANDRCEQPMSSQALDRITQSVSRYTPDCAALTTYALTGVDTVADLGTVVTCDLPAIVELGRTFGFTDTFIGHAVQASFAQQVLYSPGLGWLVWKVCRYEQVDEREVVSLFTKWVVQCRRRINTEMAETHAETKQRADLCDEDGAEEMRKKGDALDVLYKFFGKYLDVSGVNKGMEMWSAAALAAVETFDADPFLLNTPDGAVDLHTGKMRPNSMTDRCTAATAVSPDEDGCGIGGAAMWQAFLDSVTAGDKTLQNYMQVMFGLAAIGKVLHEGLYVILGEGGTGKSTMVNAVSAVMGSYAGIAPTSLLLKENGNTNLGPARAQLRGKRMVVVSELEENSILSSSSLKQVTSTDAIEANPKYKDPFSFRPSHTLLMFSNFPPRLSSNDSGTLRRLKMIPFNVNQMGKERGEVKNYADVLVREAGGAIMKWVVEGAVRAGRGDYSLPQCSAASEATESYFKDENPVAHFLEENCITEEEAVTKASDLLVEYNQWAARVREMQMSSTRFGLCMKRLGREKKHTKKGWVYGGIRLRDLTDDLRENAEKVSD